MSPDGRRQAAQRVQSVLSCSGRKAAHWLGFNRSGLRYRPKPRSEKQQQLENLIMKFSREHPTLGYKKIAGLLRSHRYLANRKTVQRVRREEGLQVPQTRSTRRRGLNCGTCNPSSAVATCLRPFQNTVASRVVNLCRLIIE